MIANPKPGSPRLSHVPAAAKGPKRLLTRKTSIMTATFRLGVDRLVEDLGLIPGRRWGLVTNYTGVTSDLELSSTALHRAGAPLALLLTPEHGLRGTVQAGESEGSGTDPETGLRILDTYRLEEEALDAAIAQAELDAIIVDLQDLGLRFYTYVWTMIDCLRSAARLGIPFFVLDRPNPLGGVEVAGPGMDEGFESFVGRLNVPIRYGLTIGELARYGAHLDRAQGRDVPDPTVITMDGWRREHTWEDTGLLWVMPSPNIPTPESALAYCGSALVEGTNLSEGRGTTRPFELVGAPWIHPSLAESLNALELPDVRFRSCWFKPTFSKWENQLVCGVQVYPLGERFRPIETAIHLLWEAMRSCQGEFRWREPHWEGDVRRPPFVDLLWGGEGLRTGLDCGHLDEVLRSVNPPSAYKSDARPFLLYKGGW